MSRHRRIALDTNVFIYEFEANPRYLVLTNAVFQWLENPEHRAVTSMVTLTKILVGPFRAGDESRARTLRGFLLNYPRLEWIPPDIGSATTAARLRVRHGLHTVDAIQVATAVHSLATCLIGNDAAFRRVTDIETILLDDYV